MDHTALFADLRACIEGLEIYACDVFEYIGGLFSGGYGDIALAVTNHVRDILHEGEFNDSWGKVLAESLRRTFFDEEGAKLYGTQRYSQPDTLPSLAASIVRSFAQGTSAPTFNVHAAPARAQ